MNLRGMPQILNDWHPPSPHRLATNQPFRLTAKAPSMRTDRPLRSRAYRRRQWLNQRDQPACTGFGAAHCLSLGTRWRPMLEQHGHTFYAGAKRNDDEAGEDYDGSSVLGVARYLHKETDLVREYWWANTLEELCHGVGYYDPVEAGTWWMTGMMDTDSEGYVNLTGNKEGGHAYCVGETHLIPGKPVQDGFGTIFQSWGPDWGVGGNARIRLGDLGYLLGDWGECVLFRPTKPVRP